ncbi:17-beta-hydroxysteroid dehydrogenase 14 isoform X2 [Antechinus flavipes]|uniref:17-beta-hydroxysteroid dehydrogenase 14 isoform X2 n=1 Tax=Antechinus flavipes TaxID=38775 RepID=UPI0022363C48|nr:17-beta-hydroxysteroid dehydrogenase 14 isoform X2 [Antechinus flavipes]
MASGPCSQGRVVLVTGGARGIGAGIVRAFVENGARVIICDRDESGGRALEKELRLVPPPAGAVFIQCDVTREAEVQALIFETLRRFGRLDCVVNNAGRHPPEELLEETSSRAFRELLELNLLAVYSVSKSRGSIINISSLVGAIGQRKAAPYVATKGAVTALTKALALDESQHGVRVNCISPGNIWTPLWKELAALTPDPSATVREGERAQPLGRMGRPDEVGAAAVFLAFHASFCTGVDLPLTGGAELGYGCKMSSAPGTCRPPGNPPGCPRPQDLPQEEGQELPFQLQPLPSPSALTP